MSKQGVPRHKERSFMTSSLEGPHPFLWENIQQWVTGPFCYPMLDLNAQQWTSLFAVLASDCGHESHVWCVKTQFPPLNEDHYVSLHHGQASDHNLPFQLFSLLESVPDSNYLFFSNLYPPLFQLPLVSIPSL